MLEYPLSYNYKVILFSNLLLFVHSYSLAQCPDNLFISSEEQLTQWVMDYPNCKVLSGNLTLEGYGTDRLQNLDALQQIKSIKGSLFIGNNLALNNLDGLSEIETVVGNVTISNNPSLKELKSFSKLNKIEGGLQILNCQQLRFLDFPRLESVGTHLTIFYNPCLLYTSPSPRD